MPNLDAKQIFDLEHLTDNVKNINETTNDTPTIQEILYFAFIIICLYLTLWTILVTTTNVAIQGIMSTLFTIANFAIFIIFAYYVAKLLQSGINFMMRDQ
jgi:hypothetical protein